MNNLPDTLLQEFTAFHDQMTRLSTSAGPDTDISALEATIHETYHGSFNGTGMTQPATFDRREGYDPFEGFRKMVGSGHTSRVENRTIRLRSESEAVVFFEHILMKDGLDVARNFFVQTYRRFDGTWKLMRETMEQVAP